MLQQCDSEIGEAGLLFGQHNVPVRVSKLRLWHTGLLQPSLPIWYGPGSNQLWREVMCRLVSMSAHCVRCGRFNNSSRIEQVAAAGTVTAVQSTSSLDISTSASSSETSATKSASHAHATHSNSTVTSDHGLSVGAVVAAALVSLGLAMWLLRRHRIKKSLHSAHGAELPAEGRRSAEELAGRMRFEKDGLSSPGEVQTRANAHELQHPPAELAADQENAPS